MLIIPAIDIRKGRCIRLAQGNLRDETIFSEEPVSVAKLWQLKGAKMIHLVDIDGAVTGTPKNIDLVLKIVKTLRIPVEFGGGIRDMETLDKVMNAGVERVILGTSAISSRDFLKEAVDKYKSAIMVGIDAKKGMVAVKGWKEVTNKRALTIAKEVQEIGVQTIMFTDIEKDGMLSGPNFKSIKELAQAVKMEVVASGGVTTMADVEHLCAMAKYGVCGMVVGKSLYTGNLDLKKVIKFAKEYQPADRRQRKKKIQRKAKKGGGK
ncbi:MAG: 1-(5-phosphoribosyl)-5-[(5-phosphoribosylamino)methylideneamino]imidazole-4-carboxamide isomerase [Candidatus Firestonebacteria bacterium]